MARYRVLSDGVSWPVGASLTKVKDAGGLSRMTEEERAGLDFNTPALGAVVDDVPESSAVWLVEQGHLELVLEGPTIHGRVRAHGKVR